MIVADPRLTETADIADLHLPLRPGSDIALLNAHAPRARRARGCSIRASSRRHTSEWPTVVRAIVARIRRSGPRRSPGCRAEIIVAAALRFGRARAALTLWSMGVNQSHVGTDKNAAILNLHLATGQIGRPGAGPFSLTGQPNAMGGRETGGLAHLLPGYRARRRSRRARRAVEAHWGVPPGRIAPRPAAPRSRSSRGWPPARSARSGSSARTRRRRCPTSTWSSSALRQAELVIVQDAYHPTETTRFADVLLPAAQWPEKDGVMTNSERRLTYLPKLVDPPGEALPDAEIIARFAREMGWKDAFPSERAADIFDEFAALTAGTPCDYSGVSHARLRAEGPLQWPVPAPDHPGTERLYTDGRFATASGRARFIAVEHDRARRAAGRRLPADPHHRARARSLAHADAHRQVPGADAPHAGAPARGQSPRRAARGRSATATSSRSRRGGARRWRRCRVSERDPRGHVLPAVSLGPRPRLLQGRQQPDARRARSAVQAARAQGAAPCASGALAPRSAHEQDRGAQGGEGRPRRPRRPRAVRPRGLEDHRRRRQGAAQVGRRVPSPADARPLHDARPHAERDRHRGAGAAPRRDHEGGGRGTIADVTTRQQVQLRWLDDRGRARGDRAPRGGRAHDACRPGWTTSAASSAARPPGSRPSELFDTAPIAARVPADLRRQQGVHQPAAQVQRDDHRLPRALHAAARRRTSR